ncbi:PepSY domain-containing protein [Geomicrobium sp. JCM 19038]|uniref:PepSY domain-containing protein n=1 Tax=Geomicrobium sp. JCM 19038 TaxID=1460635 RepID=UPI00045F18CA|nr:PepSY domain-containing protein [Geomicrobium sp. JCM 19038]GAK08776.1 hypothetical protein JCM19038_2571 [Geomicrobium sp. JCM 19038]
MRKQTFAFSILASSLLIAACSTGQALENNQSSVDRQTAINVGDDSSDSSKDESQSSSPSAEISTEQASQIATDLLGGTIEKVDRDVEDGVTVYEVELYSGQEDFDVDIDVATGDILNIDGNLLEAENTIDVSISQEEAEDIARNQTGLADIAQIELEMKSQSYVYDIEMLSIDDDTDIVIDANSGDVYSMDTSIATKGADAFKDANLMPRSELESILVEQFGEDLTIKDLDLDRENGKFMYEVEIIADNVRYELVVDAENGTLLEQEIDD